MAKKPTTIRDIAELVGTSPTTVSFVLNDRCKEMRISEKLRLKVLQAAEDTSYRPSMVARGLATKKTYQLTAAIPYVSEGYGPALIGGIESEARTRGYQITISAHRNQTELLAESIERALDSSFDGLIVVPTLSFRGRGTYKELLECGQPVVFVEREMGEENISVVTTDGVRSGSMAVRHLASQGHRRIALYELARGDQDSTRRRMGHRIGHEEASLSYDPALIMGAMPEGEDAADRTAEAILKDVMGLPDPPTAIVGISALRCVEIYQGLLALGYRVPDDVSLIAITGQTFGSFHLARITSVRFSYEEMGVLACRTVIDAIENPGSHPQRTYVPGATG